MKKLLLLITILLFTPFITYSQISVLSTDLTQVGNLISRKSDTMTVLTAGPAGPNQNWIMTNISSYIIDENTTVDAPAQTPTSYYNSIANQALSTDNQNWQYINLISSNCIANNFLNSGNVSVPLNNDMLLHNFPRTYGSRFSDTYSSDITVTGTEIGQPTINQFRFKLNGTVFDTTDGWGTITTPLASYNSLRVKRVDFISDTVWIKLFSFSNWVVFSAKKDTIYSYKWYAKETKMAVAEIINDSLDQPKIFTWSLVPPLGVVTVNATNNTCYGTNGGSATALVNFGTSPHTYLWSPSGQTNVTASGLSEGLHSVTVTDFYGQTYSGSATINQPPQISFNTSPINCMCFGDANGSITISASGGTGTKQYSKDGGANYQGSNVFSNLTAATYPIVVKDANNCITAAQQVIITEPSAITSSIQSQTNVHCYSGTNGAVVINATGGTGILQYSWSPNVSPNNTASNLSVGSYTCTVTDDNNCIHVQNISITQPSQIEQVNICLVTVDTLSTHNIIVWEKPVTAAIDSFFVYREFTQGSYQRIGALPYLVDGRFDDYDANPNVTNYRYRISALDTCGQESSLSPFHNSIHLQQLGNGNLLWSHYAIEGQQNPVQFYRVYRDNTGNGNFLPISTTVPGGNNSFTDVNFSSYPNASYVVDVAWGLSCDPSRVLTTTRSNRYAGQLPVGIGHSAGETHSMRLYPNPASSSVTLVLPENIGIQQVALYNALGQEVLRASVQGGRNELGLQGLPTGVYAVQVGTATNRLIITTDQ